MKSKKKLVIEFWLSAIFISTFSCFVCAMKKGLLPLAQQIEAVNVPAKSLQELVGVNSKDFDRFFDENKVLKSKKKNTFLKNFFGGSFHEEACLNEGEYVVIEADKNGGRYQTVVKVTSASYRARIGHIYTFSGIDNSFGCDIISKFSLEKKRTCGVKRVKPKSRKK